MVLKRHSPTKEEMRWSPREIAQIVSSRRLKTGIVLILRRTYDLCYMFGRCTKSVGLTAPAYLADMTCDRARCYVKSQYTGQTKYEEHNENDPNHMLNIEVHPNSKDKIFYI